MLLASVGQAASYTQHSATSAVGGAGTNTSQKAQQSLNRPLLATTNHNNNNKFNNNNNSSRPTATASNTTKSTSLMKTLAVRLHRGTEFIKDTVQRALVDSAATKAACRASTSSSSSSSSSTTSSFPKKSSTTTTAAATSRTVTTQSSTSTKQHTKGLNKDLKQHQNHKHHYHQQNKQHHSKSNLNEIPPPTALHRSTEARQNASSTDSLLKELCHFKPIRPMPLTRNKLGTKPPGCDIKTPKFIQATKKDIAIEATSSSGNSSSINLSNQNLHQPSVLKLAASNTTTKTSHTIRRQQQCKSAFVCLKINGNEIIKTKKQQSKTHANLLKDTKQKPRRRRRRNAFGVPRRRVRNKKLVDEIDDEDADDTAAEPTNPTVKNINAPQEKRTYRKRKTNETNKQQQFEEAEEVSVAATDDDNNYNDNDDDDLINNFQPTKSKRKRLTKDCQAMNHDDDDDDALNVLYSLKNIVGGDGGAKLKSINKKLEAIKKIATNSSTSSRKRKSYETLRRSPPMTRQRARQISSYNQSK